MMNRIVWSAVSSVAFGLASLSFAYSGRMEMTVACGLCAIATAILANRDRA